MKSLRTYGIIDYLKQKKRCSIQELTDRFRVSVATIYRDIAELAARDMVQKVRGGIALNERPAGQRSSASSPFQERLLRDRDRKEAIAQKALRKIEENDILFLDSSTTVYYLALLLEKSNFSNLTIVPNSFPPIRLMSPGTKYPSRVSAASAQLARQLSRQMNAVGASRRDSAGSRYGR